MPSLLCRHNTALSADATQTFADTLCREVAATLGKDPAYMLVTVEKADALSMNGSGSPAACLELSALGLTADQVGPAAERITALCTEHLGTPPSRTYLIATNVPRTHWAWEGKTFG